MTATNLPAFDGVAIADPDPDPDPQGYMYATNVEGNAAYSAAIAGKQGRRADHRRAGDETHRCHQPAVQRGVQPRNDLHRR